MRSTILAPFLIIAIALAGCTAAPSAPAAADAAGEEAAAVDAYANPDVLVDSEWVQAHLEDADVHILEIGGDREAYDEGHIPGALYVNLGEEMTNPDDSTRGQILTAAALSELMSRLGVENDDTVVVYDGRSNLLSTRAYWALKYYQHPDVRVYNGGSTKWVADGNELSTDVPEITPAEYVAGEADPEIRTTAEYVMEHIDDPSTVMCDTRNPEEFAGTDVRAERGGHIPGAINVEWVHAVNDDGTFRDAAFLSDLYQKAGFTPDKEVITYCQTGVRGAHTWFVLKELLGYPQVRNYDGSWEEYGNNAELPIEQ